MELLYFVDNSIMRSLQALSAYITRKIGLVLYQQWRILLLLGISLPFLDFFIKEISFIYTSGPHAPSFNILLDALLEALYRVLPIVIFSITLSVSFIVVYFVGILLIELHFFLDADKVMEPESAAQTGYFAWSLLIVACMLFICTYIFYGRFFSLPFAASGWVMASCAYKEFVERKRSNRKRKKHMSEAFRAFLERCKSFIPQPLPEA
jgi:hypothetical protein